ncbi:DnaA regulatory inactivator Hda [Kaarinaea lacus]
MVSEQLTLRFGWKDGFLFSNYLPADNEAAVHFLESLDFSRSKNISNEHFAYFWGSDGSGKSHLLQAACQQVADSGNSVAYLPLAEFEELNSEMFGGLEQLSLICIDDVQVVAGNDSWEEALFHLYNRVHEAKKILLVAGNVAPTALPVKLPDLSSRLTWGPVFHLQGLNDEQKVEALCLRAKGRGFELPGEVAQFLIKRSPRDMASLFNLLDKLDEASLSQHRKLTIPFVRDLL